MRRLTNTLGLIIIATLYCSAAAAEEHVVGQKDKAFSVKHLKIKSGDSVKFTNNDPFFHNIFSLSPAATFDLGSYSQGKFESIQFSEPGMIEVECAIHPTMKMTVEVHD